MNTTQIWEKHFGDTAAVGINHQNIENFFDDLNADCIREDIEAGRGWTTPTLRHVDNQWRIYSDTGVAFVPLDKASPELLAACPGAARQLEILDNEPF